MLTFEVSVNLSCFHVNFDTSGQDKYLSLIDPEDNLFASLDQCNSDFCNYLYFDQVNNIAPDDYLSIAHINIRSLAAHIDGLEVVLTELGLPTVLGICKTWLTPENDTLYCLPGYSILSNSRIKKSGGGVALMISNSVSFKGGQIFRLLDLR